MDVCETYNKRTARGTRGINLHELSGARSLNSHITKEFACGGLRGSLVNPERYTCSACPRPARNVSPMNSEVKSINNGVKS
ncbi:hypothetical protein J1N35_017397 [Gossypium stocksii]|uniref:Uncharacterized protein n=1 Tax=Gossypium stocksii TaxID=47602 RepID=A0A9D3VP59_9ROSI|nr:hypothetical protein J1N35_017397 [Gossypium stocksii]